MVFFITCWDEVFPASDDLRAKLQPSGVIEAQCGSRSSTGWLKRSPWGPHMTIGLNSRSPRSWSSGGTAS